MFNANDKFLELIKNLSYTVRDLPTTLTVVGFSAPSGNIYKNIRRQIPENNNFVDGV